ncbi:MAG: T9SS type A sorting domain-containing protein [Lishizhenia sp.]
MKALLFSLFIGCTNFILSQGTTLISNLTNPISESSGLLYLNNKLITHNDSGDTPDLYEFDPFSGNINRKVHIANAQNIDWEDLAKDENYIYIADFGNNQGNRTDLKVYRVAISDYLNTVTDTVYADSITFSYADQTDFSTTNFSTQYDAEALICFRDSLFIFTKNWNNSTTSIYALPKTIGNHSITKQDSLNTGFLVTGADYDTVQQKIALIGYGFNSATVLEISSISGKISNANLNAFALNCTESYQVEGVIYTENNCLSISAEQHSSGAASLYEYCLPTASAVNYNQRKFKVYPNPTKKWLNLELEKDEIAKIVNLEGKIVIISKKEKIDISNLDPGNYQLIILSNNGKHRKGVTFIKN